MKITRDLIYSLIEKQKSGISYEQICRRLRLFGKKRQEKASKALKLLEKDGLIHKHKGRYKVGGVVSRRKRTKTTQNDFRTILDKYKLQDNFNADLLQEAERCRRDAAKEMKKRRMPDEWIITIDAATAKDLDDAVSVRRVGLGYELGVHIADVSWYVKKNSLLDKEAFERGTSVYLINKVVPMFPEVLSNDLCSLNADSKKLCFSVYMNFTRKGRLKDVRFERTAVKVNRRFSYKEVEEIIQGKTDPDAKKLRLMSGLSKVLREARMKQGSLLFDVPEIKIKLNKNDDPVDVYIPERLSSEKMIEEFMLSANQHVAWFLSEKGVSLFRIHEDPDKEKLDSFYDYAGRMGLSIPRSPSVTPVSMQRILDNIRSNPAAGILNMLLIRSLQKAVYSTSNPGHFGLAFATYTHFTSPIRRYPDLIVHRLLDAAMRGKRAYSPRKLKDIAARSTEREQLAMSAERDMIKIKGARFLETKIGESLKGRITSVVSWGLFVTILPYGLDGMLHVGEMKDDRYFLDAYGHALLGKRRGRSFAIGDIIDVSIKSVNPEKGFVDLVLK